MVVGGGATIAHLAASQATMHDDLLPITPKCGANRLHQTAAFVLPIAGRVIHMLRMETEWAMIPMPATADRRADEGFATPALEFFGFGLPARWRPVGALVPAVGCVTAACVARVFTIVCNPIDSLSCA